MEYTNCPNCNAEINNTGYGKFGNVMANPKNITFLNKYAPTDVSIFCQKCERKLSDLAYKNHGQLLKENTEALKSLIEYLPVINIDNPQNWEYEIISILSAQYVTGTGFLTELRAEISDFLGTESSKMNKRISDGEIKCMFKMKLSAIALGGNAIIGVDIDYAEMGSIKNMIMVCTTGTAIRLKNPENFIGKNKDKVIQLTQVIDLLLELKQDYEQSLYR